MSNHTTAAAMDAAVNAGLETHDWDMFEPQQGDLGDAVGVAITAAIEAAMPHIRKQIAEEIRAEAPLMGARKGGKIYHLALTHAADIVEGES